MGSLLDQRDPRFADRVGEQSALARALEAAAAGRPTAVLVHGEAGVGKTRLVREMCATAVIDGVEVLWGTCVHFGAASLPFAPVVGALQSWLTRVGDSAAQAIMSGSEIEALLPVLRGERVHEPGRLLPLVDSVVNRIARSRPTVVVVDDLQWADVASLDVLAYLIAGFSSQSLMLVVTCRDEHRPEGHPLHGWLADMRRMPSFTEIELGRLDLAGTEAQITGLLGREPDVGFTAQVLERSDGNPYLTELLVRGVSVDAPELPRRSPTALRDALLAKWHGLSVAARQVMRVLAVGGRPVDFTLLAGAAAAHGVAPSELPTSLAESEDQGVVRRDDDGMYWFRHPLLAEVLYESLPPGVAEQIHATYVRVLAAAGSVAQGRLAADLAVHNERAGSRDEAFRWSIRAADFAEGLRASAEEATHLERACRLWAQVSPAVRGPDAGRVDLLLRACRAAARAARLGTAGMLVQQAVDLVDRDRDPLLASTLIGERHQITWDGSGPSTSVDTQLYGAVELTERYPDSAERAHALSVLASAENWDGLPIAAEHAEQALRTARRSGSRLALADALNTRAAVRLDADDIGGLEDAEEAFRLATSCGDSALMVDAAIWRFNGLWWLGRVEEAAAVARRGFDEGMQGGSLLWANFLAGMAADAMLFLGRWDECRTLLREALAARCGGIPAAIVRLTAAQLAVRTGQLPQAQQHFDRALELVSSDFAGLREQLAVTGAEVFLAAGEPARAVDWIQARQPLEVAGSGRFSGDLAVQRVAATADLAQAARDAGDRDAVETATDLLDECVAKLPVDWFTLPDTANALDRMSRALLSAHVARGQNAPGQTELWERAVLACRAARAPWDEALACLRWGRAAVAERRSRAYVGGALRRGRHLAQQLGARPLADEIEALARVAQVSLIEPVTRPRPAGSPVALATLTTREREVLDHLVAGRSNSEIADVLVISDKTASVHVSNILRKTGTSSRFEAAELARRLA